MLLLRKKRTVFPVSNNFSGCWDFLFICGFSVCFFLGSVQSFLFLLLPWSIMDMKSGYADFVLGFINCYKKLAEVF